MVSEASQGRFRRVPEGLRSVSWGLMRFQKGFKGYPGRLKAFWKILGVPRVSEVFRSGSRGLRGRCPGDVRGAPGGFRGVLRAFRRVSRELQGDSREVRGAPVISEAFQGHFRVFGGGLRDVFGGLRVVSQRFQVVSGAFQRGDFM